MNDIKHLKCLSSVRSMSSIRPLTPAAFPGNHCPMHTALSLGARIEGMSTLVIGTAECSYYSRNVPNASRSREQGLHWTYLLDSREVVFGFRDGLIDAIKEMDKAGAKVILLLATCVPELIGEDIESICYEIQTKVRARLVHIPLGNFKCGSYEPGYWKTLLAIGKLTEKVQERKKTVNILGRSSQESHIPMPELIVLLKSYDVPLRFLAPDSSVEDFISAGDAQMNIILSPFMNPLAEWMAQVHEIPFLSLHDIYDTKEIENAYLHIEQCLGIEIGCKFAERLKYTRKIQKKAVDKIRGLQYISADIGALQPLPLSVYLSKLGMEPVMIHMEEFYPSDMQWKEKIISLDKNPVICLMLNKQGDGPLIEAMCPDMVLGDWDIQGKGRPPMVQLLDLYGQVGYERTVTILKRITDVLMEGKGEGENGAL